jgi:hypothetical protein
VRLPDLYFFTRHNGGDIGHEQVVRAGTKINLLVTYPIARARASLLLSLYQGPGHRFAPRRSVRPIVAREKPCLHF